MRWRAAARCRRTGPGDHVSDLFKQLRIIVRSRERRLFAILLFVLLLNGILETAGVASIMPFMTVVVQPELVQSNQQIRAVYEWFGFEGTNRFLIAFGSAVLVLTALGNGFDLFARWLQYRTSWRTAHEIATRLLRGYTARPYEFFLHRNTTEMNKQVLAEVNQFVNNVLYPGTEVVARLIVMALMLGLLVSVNGRLAVTVLLVVGGFYVVIYLGLRGRIRAMGTKRLTMMDRRYKTAGEVLSGIKQVKIQDCETQFTDRFEAASLEFSTLQAKFLMISDVPRQTIEVIAFGGIISIVLFLIASGKPFDSIVPLLSLYALAAYKLLPSAQKTYVAFTLIRYHYPLVLDLARDLQGVGDAPRRTEPTVRLPFGKALELRDVSFRYERSDELVLRNIDLVIPAGTRAAFVGPTGAGKSTLVDLITGLLAPTEGQILVDGTPLTPDRSPRWRASLGYVPQDVFLLDETITRNIAFGIPDDAIDLQLVREVAAVARIADFIETQLPQQYETVVGERGVRLSGGQRQRLGLARALYRHPDVLILDEATSALDGITEREVIEAIEALPRDLTTIMIAHRLTTVQHCDRIWLIDGGRIAALGTYDELSSQNQVFRQMARLTR
jgi:ABC-type multidrug transport system fused ATPase/permease subunit